jgi:hypothetical protein
MAIVKYMPHVNPPEILDTIDRVCDTTGWVRKELCFTEYGRAVVKITFKDAQPREFHLVSNSMFSDLGDVKIYEVNPLANAVAFAVDRTPEPSP